MTIEPWVTSAPALDSLTREVREIGSREEWLDWRTRDYPCSVLGALFQVHDFVEMTDVVARMQGREVRRETRSMRAGTWLHKIIPDMVDEERPDWRIVEATTYHRIADLRFGGTPDDWIFRCDKDGDLPHTPDNKGVLECKTINERSWYEEHHGVPPLYWNLQLQGYLLLTGLEWGAIAVIVRNSELPLYLFEVEAHPAAQAKILAAVADFWKRYDGGEFPVPQPADEIAAMLDDGSHVDLSDDTWLIDEALPQRERLVEMIGDAERQRDMINDQIKLRMGPASTAYVPGWEISCRKQHRKEFTVPAKDIRVLRVKRIEESEDE